MSQFCSHIGPDLGASPLVCLAGTNRVSQPPLDNHVGAHHLLVDDLADDVLASFGLRQGDCSGDVEVAVAS